MLAIKLKRIGKKDQASYRVVVAEKRSKVHGRFVDDLGWYNPHTRDAKINDNRAKYWISKGAQPTDSVHNLLVYVKAIEGKSRPAHAKKKVKKGEEGAKT